MIVQKIYYYDFNASVLDCIRNRYSQYPGYINMQNQIKNKYKIYFT